MNTGTGGIFAPPDVGFPQTGALNQPGWACAEVDLNSIANVRADGHVRNRTHWVEQDARVNSVTLSPL